MEFTSWFPAITTSGLLAIAAYLGRELISTRLTKSVQHEFDRKIEALRTELRISEERLKAELREKEAEISALRSGALSSLASRYAALDKRRLEAVDQLWSAHVNLAKARWLAKNMGIVKFEVAAKESERNPKAREVFQLLGGDFDVNKLDINEAHKARPFVSPMAWAVFTAAMAVAMHGVTRWQVLRSGIGKTDIIDDESVKKLIIEVLPQHADYYEQQGPSVFYTAMDAMEQRLLSELQAMLAGVENDKATVQRASEIIRHAEELHAAARQSGGAA